MDEAFFQVCGWRNATDGVHMAGSTDAAIFAAVVERFPGDPAPAVEAIQDAYLAALSRRILGTGRARPCPGVPACIDALAAHAHLGLLTGNWRRGAWLKLGAAGLPDFGRFGAFGDDAADRNALVPIARTRARHAGLPEDPIFIIGDTPADVACARAGNAVAVAVKTGFSTPDALIAMEPDLLLEDLESGLAALMDAVLAAKARY